MEESDFKRLLNNLDSNKKCILVLGPEFINIDSSEVDFTVSIQDYLAERKFPELSKGHYFSEDGFLQFNKFIDHNEITDILTELSNFYKKLEVTPSYDKLARLPFTSIISLSPDDLIVKAYGNINKGNEFCRYKNSGFQDAPLETSEDKPLIYNMVGHYDYPNNLVFTFDNLFIFLNKIFQNDVFPNFRAHITEADSFLFLGFNYSKWYLKLIFYMLEKFRGVNSYDFSTNAIFNYNVDEKAFNAQKIEYFKKGSFKLNFSQENEKEFIEKLFNACRGRGILSDINLLQGVDVTQLNDTAFKKYRILFLGASPIGKLTLRVGEEYQDINKVLTKDFYELLEPVYNFRKDDIRTAVNKTSPSLLYITCHGTDDGELILSTGDNTPIKLPLTDLRGIIKLLWTEHKQLKCIVFSACKSEKQAKEISTIIPYCIGMRESVDEDISMIFTRGFFQGFINDKQNIEYAFNNGVSAIKNHDDAQKAQFFNLPVLYINGEIYSQ